MAAAMETPPTRKKANRQPAVPATVRPPMAVAKKPPATWPREEVRKRAPKARPRAPAG
jgi:hypothetical protein